MKFVLLALLLSSQPGVAEDLKSYQFTITKSGISPKQVQVPANKNIQIVVKNDLADGEEFEIIALDMEIGVQAHKTETFQIGPLKPGKYKYSGHELPGGEFIVK